jgi:hypothetical protein
MDEIQDRADAGSHANDVAVSDSVPQEQGNKWEVGYGHPPMETRFRPGVSGNPGGRSKNQSLTALLREIIEQDELGGKKIPGGKRVKNLVLEAIIKQALKGDIRHLQEILNRLDGKLTERVEHTGWGGGPIEVDATVCGLSAEQVDAWRQKKRAEISARPTGPPP